MAHWKVFKNGYKTYVRSPEEQFKRMQDQEARRQQRYQEEQRAVSQAMLEELRGIRQGLESQPVEAAPLTEAPQRTRERGYWVKAVKQLHDQLKENGTLHLFDECIGSPSEMLGLMHSLELCTIDERDDRHVQKYVGNAIEKYKNAASERMLERAEPHQDRSTRGNISELAQNGMVEDKNRNGKAWDLS